MSLKAFLKSRKFLTHFALSLLLFAVLLYLTTLMLKMYTHHGKTLSVPDFIGLSESEVDQIVKESKLRYQIIDSSYVAETIPGTIIAQHPERGHRVKQRRNVYLTIASTTPEKSVLPTVVYVSLREAQSRLENAGFRLGNVIYIPSEDKDLVLEKRFNGAEIPEDTLLIKGTAIDLIVGKGLSNEVTIVPALIGFDVRQSKQLLYSVSLNVGALVYDDSFYSARDSMVARVWKQSPEYSSTNYVELGTSIDLWLTIDQEKIDLATEIEF